MIIIRMLDKLANLHKLCFPHKPWTARDFMDLQRGGAEIIASENGFIVWRVAADEAEIISIGVAPAARGTGTADALLAMMEKEISFVSPLSGGSVGEADKGGLKHRRDRLCANLAQSYAKTLRTKMTMYECLLWKKLRRSPGGFSFRKQHPIGKYIVDFINLEHNLIIELDGAGHAEDRQIKHDAIRDKYLTDSGYRIIRFWNRQVYRDMQNIMDTIHCYLTNDHLPNLRGFYPKEIIQAPPSQATPDSPPRKGGHKSCKKIFLEVAADNIAAIKLYKRNGYLQVGIRRGYYDGTDAIVMSKKIASRTVSPVGE